LKAWPVTLSLLRLEATTFPPPPGPFPSGSGELASPQQEGSGVPQPPSSSSLARSSKLAVVSSPYGTLSEAFLRHCCRCRGHARSPRRRCCFLRGMLNKFTPSWRRSASSRPGFVPFSLPVSTLPAWCSHLRSGTSLGRAACFPS
jgi:hypothetical protein